MRDPGSTIVNPRAEYLTDPIGTHARRPRLSWEVGSSRRGAIQAAYRIVAGSAPDATDRWDSGWVSSRDTHGVRYGGAPVGARERVWWRVKVRDDAGYPEIAYRLLHQEGYPSWKYPILQGATTIWERWDGWTEERGFQTPTMNSFNHYALGSVGAWLRRRVAGIDTDGPGYRRVTIAPVLDRSLAFAEGSYRAITGEIRSAWAWTDDGYRLEVTIPANVDATITLPGAADVTETGTPIADAEGVRSVDETGNATVITVGAGTYAFEVTGMPAPATGGT